MRPRLPRAPLAHRLMLGVSCGVLIVTALVLWRTLPRLPAQIPLHFSSGQPDRLGAPSELWTLWWVLAAIWGVLLLVAAAAQKAGRLNGMPVPSAEDQPRVRMELRGLLLALQLLVTLSGGAFLISQVVWGLGGPQLDSLALLPVAAVPVVLGYGLYRISAPARPA